MKKTFLEDTLSAISKAFLVLIVIAAVLIGFSGLKIVKSGEVAVILRFGKLVGETREEQIHEPGLLFAFPYFIDEVVTVSVDQIIEQTVETHYSSGALINVDGTVTGSNDSGVNVSDGAAALYRPGYLITGDQNITLVRASVKYTISDPVQYALYVNSVGKLLNGAVSNAMMEEASSTGVDAILTSGKEQYARNVLGSAQTSLDRAGAGITIQAVELTNVTMPEEVRSVYEQVNSATVEASTLMENAYKYRNTTIPAAESYANSLVQKSQSDSSYAILTEFWGVLNEYNESPYMVRYRIYTEKMLKTMSTIGTVRVVTDDESRIIINR